MKQYLRTLTLILAFWAHPGTLQTRPVQAEKKPTAALSPFIEVHSHLNQSDTAASIQATLRAMPKENAAKVIFMPSPFAPEAPTRFDEEVLMAAEKDHRDKLAFLGGGGTLNVMIQQAVRSGDSGPELQKKFRDRAEEIMRHGASGFGEMTTEHFAMTPTQYYEYAPADHPLFLLLADISAAHDGAPICIHMEAVPKPMPIPAELLWAPNAAQLHENIAPLERLLAHNRRAKIVWAHGGWDNTGYRTPELTRRLLQAHPNLYIELKLDPQAPGKNTVLTNGGDGMIKAEWLKIFQDFPDQFIIGSDQSYPEPANGPQHWEASVTLLNQLPAGLRQKIGFENAARIYHLK